MLLACINSAGGAFMDVVVDGLMVISSRQDPTSGSEELQAYSWGFYGLGGIVGCLLSGYFLGPMANPYPCFYMMTVFGASVGISGLFIDKSLEENQTEMVRMGLIKRSKLVFGEVAKGLKLKELYTAVIYQTILGAVVPSFSAYLYYYQIEVTGFTQFEYSMLQLIGYATLISGSVMFNLCLKESEFNLMMIIACLVNCAGSVTTMLFCLKIYLGMPPFLFVLLTSTVTDTLYQSFVQLPLQVLFAKLIPEKIEASLFAFLTGLSNLNNLFISQNLGNLINLYVGDTKDTLEENTWKLYAIQGVLSLVPLLFIWLVPKRAQVTKIQRCLEYIDK